MGGVQQWILPGILFLITVGFGFWVKKTGKPYPGLLFNLHKLIALGATVLTGIRIFRLDPWNTFSSNLIFIILLAVLGLIAIYATGAVISIQDQVNKTPKLIHQISAGIIAGAMIIGIFALR